MKLRFSNSKDELLIARLRKALLFYAENSRWQSSGRFNRPDILSDRGQVACEALKLKWPHVPSGE